MDEAFVTDLPGPRLAVRAVILHHDRLLLVNAFPGGRLDLWCAPGGGVRRGESLPDALRREVHEETGLVLDVGLPCLVNEFHDPGGTFHQVDVFFRAAVVGGFAALEAGWRDPEGVVDRWRLVSRDEAAGLVLKPASLPGIAWGGGFGYDPLEPIMR